MEVFMWGNAGDGVFDQWFALAEPAERDRLLDNGAVLFPTELPWVATFVPDRDRMRASGVPLTVVAGADNRDTWFGAATTWLTEGTGFDRVELPAVTPGSSPTRRSLLPWSAGATRTGRRWRMTAEHERVT
jgi:hypothetical protein